MLSDSDFIALTTTLKLASVSTLILIILATPLAWWLARSSTRLKVIVEAFIALPLSLVSDNGRPSA